MVIITQETNLDKDAIIRFLREHKPHLEKNFGVTKIALFGSYARGEQTQASDIDVLIETTNASFDNYCSLKAFLEDSFKRRVDLGYFKSIRRFIKRSIEEELFYA